MKNLLLTILCFGFVSVAYGAIRSVDVKDASQTKNIQAEVNNITQGTEIDTTLPITANEKAQIATAFLLTEAEKRAVEGVLTGNLIDPNDLGAYVSGVQKMAQKRGLSDDEVKELYFSGKSPKEGVKYLYAKEKKEF